MAKTADVQQSIWGDPWFLALSANAKVLYLWAITTTHGNLAGLFMVAEPMVCLETGLSDRDLAAALSELKGKILYRRDTGALWVRGKAKRIRSKTTQIAKSVAKAVRECPSPEIQGAFLAKYGNDAWLKPAFLELGLEAPATEPALTVVDAPPPDLSGMTEDEQKLVDSLLRAFNVEANGVYKASTWSDRMVACLRAHPDLTESDHLRVVRTAFRTKWWRRTDPSRHPSPGVIWGSLEQFEKCVGEMLQQQSLPEPVSYEDATEVIAQ